MIIYGGWLVGWLVYSYTDPPFGMQGSLGPGTTPEPGSKLDLIGLARTPSGLAGPPAKAYIPPIFKNGRVALQRHPLCLHRHPPDR